MANRPAYLKKNEGTLQLAVPKKIPRTAVKTTGVK